MLKRPLLVKQPEIGGLIREFRLLTGLTQEQFGAYLGVTYGTINRWENERSKPSPMAIVYYTPVTTSAFYLIHIPC
ncbi:helix-turn-helix domain-containing protein [Dolichospermum flos-aquae]|uniref:Helix-turn-helix transcriptional regulator n=2 Tax=Nostocales TaxID=1161 RepID=A0ACC7S9U4_DOLFA|nr:helix-turn-helix transcriptional regulator [Anabaena sp. 54]MBO1067338.1 helix-turn-helix transcriptional regulator [Anabaena sp. 54]MTJ44994.1 helix-turn-helix transcriptional regulator [Dolichospermum flos-aquae UHCC 0037]